MIFKISISALKNAEIIRNRFHHFILENVFVIIPGTASHYYSALPSWDRGSTMSYANIKKEYHLIGQSHRMPQDMIETDKIRLLVANSNS